jgi:hypothetical protein
VPEPGVRDAELFVALQRGDPEEVGALIAQGADVSRGGRDYDPLLAPLHVAVILAATPASTCLLDLERNRWTRKVSDD